MMYKVDANKHHQLLKDQQPYQPSGKTGVWPHHPGSQKSHPGKHLSWEAVKTHSGQVRKKDVSSSAPGKWCYLQGRH